MDEMDPFDGQFDDASASASEGCPGLSPVAACGPGGSGARGRRRGGR